ncbi:hypothetical protein GCM10009528_14900 [Kineococcus aurantiacus]
MLRRGRFGQAVGLATRLHLQEGDERPHLFLHRVQADEAVEFGLQHREGSSRPGTNPAAVPEAFTQFVRAAQTGASELVAEALAELPDRVAQVVERLAVEGHAASLEPTASDHLRRDGLWAAAQFPAPVGPVRTGSRRVGGRGRAVRYPS